MKAVFIIIGLILFACGFGGPLSTLIEIVGLIISGGFSAIVLLIVAFILGS